MSNMTLTANSSYVHDPTPGVVISMDPVYDDNGVFIGTKQVWSIKGTLIGPNISTKVAALETEYKTSGLSALELKIGASVVESIAQTNSGAHDNDKIPATIDFSEGTGVEWVTKRKYEIKAETPINGLIFPEGSDSVATYKYTSRVDQNTESVQSYSGQIKTDTSKDIDAEYTTWKSTWGIDTPPSNHILVNEIKSTNLEETVLSFTIEFSSIGVPGSGVDAYPAGCTEGDASTETSTDEDDITYVNLSGFFVGSIVNCDNAIDAERPTPSGDFTLLGEDITRNEYEFKTSFSIRYIGGAATDILATKQTVSIAPILEAFVMKRVVNDFPVKQVTSFTSAVARESGTTTKVGSYPAADTPRSSWINALISSNTTRLPPRVNRSSGDAIYTVTWDYVYEDNENFSYTDA